LVSFKLIVFRF